MYMYIYIHCTTVYMLIHYVYMLYTHSNTRSSEIACTARASIRMHYRVIVFVPNTSMLILIPKLVTQKLATSWRRVSCSLSKKILVGGRDGEKNTSKLLVQFACFMQSPKGMVCMQRNTVRLLMEKTQYAYIIFRV